MALTVASTFDIEQLAAIYADKTPQDIIRAAVDNVPNLTFACSFGAEDVALLDMIMKIEPQLPIFYLDTDVLFPETYALRDIIEEKYHPNLIRVSPALTLAEQAAQQGEALWASRPDQCCAIRKVKPLEDMLARYNGWITGIRRDQAPTRANAQVFEADHKFGLVKVNPLAFWTSDQVWEYIHAESVPYNPLHEFGYPSIGCTHCTRAVAPGEDPRAGRWAGYAKTECGLHQ